MMLLCDKSLHKGNNMRVFALLQYVDFCSREFLYFGKVFKNFLGNDLDSIFFTSVIVEGFIDCAPVSTADLFGDMEVVIWNDLLCEGAVHAE